LLVDKYTEDRNFRDKVVLVEVKTHIGKKFNIYGKEKERLARQIQNMKELAHYKNTEAKVMKISFTIENLKYMFSPV